MSVAAVVGKPIRLVRSCRLTFRSMHLVKASAAVRVFSSTIGLNSTHDRFPSKQSYSVKLKPSRAQTLPQSPYPLNPRLQSQINQLSDPSINPLSTFRASLTSQNALITYAAFSECRTRDSTSGRAEFLSQLSESELISFLNLLRTARSSELPSGFVPRDTKGIESLQRIIAVVEKANPQIMTASVKSVLVQAWFDVGRSSDAVKLAKALLESNPLALKDGIYEALVSGLVKMRSAKMGVRLMEKALERGELKMTPQLVETVVRGLCSIGNVEEAVMILELGEKAGVKRSLKALNGIAMGYARQGKITRVFQYFKESRGARLNHDSDFYTAIIKAYVVRHKLDAAVQTYEQMLNSGLESNAQILSDLIRAHGTSGDLASAVTLFRERDHKSSIYNSQAIYASMIYAFAVNGNLSNAWQTLASAIEHCTAHVIRSNILMPIAKLHLNEPADMVKVMLELFEIDRRYKAFLGAKIAETMLNMAYKSAGRLAEPGNNTSLPMSPLQTAFSELPVDFQTTVKTAVEILESNCLKDGSLRPPLDSQSYSLSAGFSHSALAYGYLLQGKSSLALGMVKILLEKDIADIRRGDLTRLLKGAAFSKSTEVVKEVVHAMKDMGWSINEWEMEYLLAVADWDAVTLGDPKAETGAGSVEDVVGAFLAEGGVVTDDTPRLNSFMQFAGLKSVVEDLIVYNAIRQKKLNEQSLVVLKERITTLYSAVQNVYEESQAIQKGLQAVSDLLRRFHSAIQSSILLIEKQDSSLYMTRVFNASAFRQQISQIYEEFNGVMDDINMILTMKSFREAIHNSNRLKQVADTLEQSKVFQTRWVEAIQKDLKNNESLLLDLARQVEVNRKQQQQAMGNLEAKLEYMDARQKVDMDNIYGNFEHLGSQAHELAEGIHAHLDDVQESVAGVNAGVQSANAKLDGIHAIINQGQRLISNQMDQQKMAMGKMMHRNIYYQTDHIKSHQVPSEPFQLLSSTSAHFIYKIHYLDVSGNPESKQVCVFKVINPGPQQVIGAVELARREIEVTSLKKLQASPYFPQILGLFRKDANTMGFIMEGAFYGDSETPMPLREYLHNNIVEWSMRIRFIRQITAAMVYMHANSQSIIHGGLNSGDILVSLDNKRYEHIKIIDFDRSQIADGQTYRPFNDYATRVDQHPYIAPELFANGYTTVKTDIFALGTLLWELATCSTPYDHIDPHSVRQHIVSGNRDLVPVGEVDGCPPPLAEAIRACWDKDPLKRPTAMRLEEILYELYMPNQATSRTVSMDTSRQSVEEWRDVYLRARMGVSEDDLVSVRVVAEILTHPRFSKEYAKSETERWEEAVRLCKVAVETKADGGAAYHLATKLYGKSQTEEYSKWMEVGRSLGHPNCVLAVAKVEYEAKKLDQMKFMEVAQTVKAETALRDKAHETRKLRRREMGALAVAAC
ncbi:hypothetical protein HDV05_000596 [Chytridiales sp. JEL 0842]|nr:hypothetical protein HDV05_000596 [Chytridiales sp. JEL 0842]